MDNNDYYQPAGTTAADDSTAAVSNAASTDSWENPIAQVERDDTPVASATDVPASQPANDMTPPEAARAEKDPAEAYDAFIDALIQDLGFNKVDEPQKTELVNAITQRVEARVLRTLLTSLTSEQTDEINKEIDEKGLTEEGIIELLTQKAPNAGATILSALDDLYQEMKEETDVIWKAAAGKAAADQDASAQ